MHIVTGLLCCILSQFLGDVTLTSRAYRSRDSDMEIKAGFSSYAILIEEEEELYNKAPIMVYPEDEEELDMEIDIQEDPEMMIDRNDDIILMPDAFNLETSPLDPFTFTAYKRVDKKVNPVSGTFPEEARVRRQIPQNPLLSLPKLEAIAPDLEDTPQMNQERLDKLEINSTGFLWPEEEKLFEQVM